MPKYLLHSSLDASKKTFVKIMLLDRATARFDSNQKVSRYHPNLAEAVEGMRSFAAAGLELLQRHLSR